MSVVNQINSGCLSDQLLTFQDYLHYIDSHLQLFFTYL